MVALRIAVDEADWRFNNVTQAQVYKIRDGVCFPLTPLQCWPS
jgi:hypothetical protein